MRTWHGICRASEEPATDPNAASLFRGAPRHPLRPNPVLSPVVIWVVRIRSKVEIPADVSLTWQICV
jgi:hypothetical protein